ncbi:c-type cytochrome [Novilysobacter antarcticus]|uniref:c-type cytochrome n=1 Tax=Novilysobacter antarcticus TaxID=2862543 RepID=UPI001C99F0D6|nr:c-type cytochrome [Lysobacter antarcticus]
MRAMILAVAAVACAPILPAHSSDGVEADVLQLPFLDLRRVELINGDAEAGMKKTQVCANCHGGDGIAVVTEFPNLAGLSADYMYWQLVRYKRGVNPSPMTPLVAGLSDQDMRDLSVYYASLPVPSAAPAGDAGPTGELTSALLQKGEQLYLTGDPARGIPACQGCHGADARGPAPARRVLPGGQAPYAAYPALRGQHFGYLQTKLAGYRDGDMDDSTSGFVMTGVARTLDDEAIQAVAGWLSSLQNSVATVPTSPSDR